MEGIGYAQHTISLMYKPWMKLGVDWHYLKLDERREVGI
jgi:hypothetical protein